VVGWLYLYYSCIIALKGGIMNWNKIEYEVRRIEEKGEEKYIVYRTNPKRTFVLLSFAIAIIYLSPFVPLVPISKANPFSILFGVGVGILLFKTIEITKEEKNDIFKRFIPVVEFDDMESAIKYVENKKQENKQNSQKPKEEVVYRSKNK
jgi:hypothetical protein